MLKLKQLLEEGGAADAFFLTLEVFSSEYLLVISCCSLFADAQRFVANFGAKQEDVTSTVLNQLLPFDAVPPLAELPGYPSDTSAAQAALFCCTMQTASPTLLTRVQQKHCKLGCSLCWELLPRAPLLGFHRRRRQRGGRPTAASGAD
eukprot:TRINITY_DN5405_c0_g1_i1.p1 TRINITY_DN5405_c0_g1~~TRINITY_DN5405_c0_g1_i1.p1  ORF type:complete len:148 (+),score=23.87 TRINITY_DN5405_c0_g1_i1:272-715(+)